MRPSVERGEEAGAGDEVGAAVRRQIAEHVGSSSRCGRSRRVSRRLQLPRHSTWRTAMPLPQRPRAARPRRAARRGAARSSEPPSSRQERQTSIVTPRSAARPRPRRAAHRHDGSRRIVTRQAPCPGHPPGGQEFVRDGRSPGSRIVALGRLPGKSQWPRPSAIAYSCGDSCGFAARRRTAFPLSPSPLRGRAVAAACQAARSQPVNARRIGFARAGHFG